MAPRFVQRSRRLFDLSTSLTALYRSLCFDTRAIRHHSAAAELEQALLHAWFVHSMPGTLELRATPVTCREAADMVV